MIRLRIQPSVSVQPPFQDLSFSCLLVSAILKTENDPGNYEYLKEKTERGQLVTRLRYVTKKVFSVKDVKVISSRSTFYLRAVEGNFRGLQIPNG